MAEWGQSEKNSMCARAWHHSITVDLRQWRLCDIKLLNFIVQGNKNHISNIIFFILLIFHKILKSVNSHFFHKKRCLTKLWSSFDDSTFNVPFLFIRNVLFVLFYYVISLSLINLQILFFSTKMKVFYICILYFITIPFLWSKI